MILKTALDIAKENKELIKKLSYTRGMETIFEKLMEEFCAKLGEISVTELDGFRSATIHAYETVIENE